jgi:hypothetical protein
MIIFMQTLFSNPFTILLLVYFSERSILVLFEFHVIRCLGIIRFP